MSFRKILQHLAHNK